MTVTDLAQRCWEEGVEIWCVLFRIQVSFGFFVKNKIEILGKLLEDKRKLSSRLRCNRDSHLEVGLINPGSFEVHQSGLEDWQGFNMAGPSEFVEP